MIVDCTLLEVLHPRQVPKVGGIRWSFLGEVGHLQRLRGQAAPALCATNRVPISYELTAANVAEVRLRKELLEEAQLGEEVARKHLGWW